MLDDHDSISGSSSSFFSVPSRPDWLWDPPSLLTNGYQELFPVGQNGQVMKLTTHLHLVLRLRTCDDILHSHIHLHGMVFN